MASSRRGSLQFLAAYDWILRLQFTTLSTLMQQASKCRAAFHIQPPAKPFGMCMALHLFCIPAPQQVAASNGNPGSSSGADNVLLTSAIAAAAAAAHRNTPARCTATGDTPQSEQTTPPILAADAAAAAALRPAVTGACMFTEVEPTADVGLTTAALDIARTGLMQPPAITADRDTADPTQDPTTATPPPLPHRALDPTSLAGNDKTGSLDPRARSSHASAGSSSSHTGSSGSGGADELSGVFILAGYEDGTVAVWDATSPLRPVASARLHSEPVMCVTCSVDGKGGGPDGRESGGQTCCHGTPTEQGAAVTGRGVEWIAQSKCVLQSQSIDARVCTPQGMSCGNLCCSLLHEGT